MNTKGTRKTLPLVMAAILAFSAFTFTPGAARADVAGVAGPVGLPGTIDIGTGAEANPTVIGFGGQRCVVIGYNGTGVASLANHMTLLKEGPSGIGSSLFNPFNDGNAYLNAYSGSSLQTAMDAAASALSAGELSLIAPRDLVGGAADDAQDGMAGANVNGALFWPLSVSEANQVNSTLRQFGMNWWLRSPGAHLYYASSVDFFGGSVMYYNDVDNDFGVRPAFNLDLSSVLFTSAATAAGAAGVSGLAAYTAPTGAIKFTAQDSDFSIGFGITETAVSGAPGKTVTLHYTGAATGTDHFIRVKLVKDDASGQIAYMAVPVSNITAAVGSFTLTLPSGMPTGTYTAYAWAEQGNGPSLTNQGSKPDTFALSVQPVIFTPSPSSINLSNPTNLVFKADAPALLMPYTFIGVSFQNVTVGTGFGKTLDSSDGVTYDQATGVLTVPAAAFGQHATAVGGTPLPAGNYRAMIQFQEGASNYYDYYADFVLTSSGPPKPPSPLPKTGDGFPLYGLLALLGAALVGLGWLGARLRRQRKRA